MVGHWIYNGPSFDIQEALGFIYMIYEDDYYYVGRKQFWNKRGRYWYESDWKTYRSSSTILPSRMVKPTFEIIGVYYTKSAIRYCEAYAIVVSKAYETDRGLNYSFAGCRGPVKFTDKDRESFAYMQQKVKNPIVYTEKEYEY